MQEKNRVICKIISTFITLIMLIQLILPTIILAAEADNYMRIKDYNITSKEFTVMYANLNSIDEKDCQVLKNGVNVAENEIVTTGMQWKAAGKIYTIVIRGDVNCDGKISATDLSQFKMHETGIEELSGARKEACDINNDTKITVLDRSQLKMLLVGLDLSDESSGGIIVVEKPDSIRDIEGEIVIKVTPEEPAKQVTIEVQWPGNIEGCKKEISTDGGETFTEYNGQKTVTENSIIVARITEEIIEEDEKGTVTLKEESYIITNIDNIAPNPYQITATTTTSSITIEGTTTDTAVDINGNSISSGIAGIAKYMYRLEGGEWQEENTFTGLKPNSTYKIYGKAIDYAGNETEATNNGMEIITKELLKASEHVSFEYSNTKPTKDNVTVKFIVDEIVKDMYTEYQLNGTDGTWIRGNSCILEENATIYVRLVDENGLAATGDWAIGKVENIDKLPPKDFTPKVVSTTSSTITVSASDTDDGKVEDGETSEEINKYTYYIISQDGEITTSRQIEEANYTYTNLKAGSEYAIFIEAEDEVGNTTQSETINANTNAKQGEFGNTNSTITGQKPDANYDNPIVPAGFAPKDTDDAKWGDGTSKPADWDKGLVIEDEKGNEFVWVPVDGTRVTYEKWTTNGESYSQKTDGENPVDEKVQINQYKGFYIARYETSDTPEKSEAGRETQTRINYRNAKEKAESMYKTNKVLSGLVTGTQWDTVMKWIANEKGTAQVDTSSTNWGNYTGTKSLTGNNEDWKAKNIYDMAGNVAEITNEFKNDQIVVRGGAYNQDLPAGNRTTYNQEYVNENLGYRIVLYVTTAEQEEEIDDGTLGIGKINTGTENVTVNGGAKSYLNPVIPVGFKAINTEAAKWNGVTPNGWNNGLAIEDVNGNQFVWVPVKHEPGEDTITAIDRMMFDNRENYSVDQTANGIYQILGEEIPYGVKEDDEYIEGKYRYKTEVVEQIKEYQGFYIARYEAGNDNGSLGSKSGLTTVSTVTYQQAKDYAERMYHTPYVRSGLPTGTQWDIMTKWISNQYGFQYVTKNTTGGNTYLTQFTFSGPYAEGPNSIEEVRGEFKNGINVTKNKGERMLIATGLVEQFRAKNIYDTYGNVWEYTSEISAIQGTEGTYHTTRGCDYFWIQVEEGNNKLGALQRAAIQDGDKRNEGGFRVMLYLSEGKASFGEIQDYDTTINGKKPAYNNPIIPAGFMPVNTAEANWGNQESTPEDWNKGLVIQDSNRNQFVWVPVDKIEVTYEKWIERGISYKETNGDEVPDILNEWGENEKTQVEKYGGFYIARYEASINGQGEAETQAGRTVATGISYTEAKKLAEEIRTDEKVKIGIATGTQWDTTMRWIANEKGEAAVLDNSTSWGNYGESIKQTGQASAKNIYDLAGNAWEWTSEKYKNQKIYRGGVFRDEGTPAGYRGAYDQNRTDEGTSFRMSLYIYTTATIVNIPRVPVADGESMIGHPSGLGMKAPNGADGIKVGYSTKEWTNKNVTITMTPLDNRYYVEYQVNGTNKNNWVVGRSYTADANCTVYARLVYRANQYMSLEGEPVKISISNIDKIAPNAFTPVLLEKTTSIQVSASTADTGSGIKQYHYYLGDKLVYTGGSSKTITGLAANTSYTIKVIAEDKAGNKTEGRTITTQTQGIVQEGSWVVGYANTGHPTGGYEGSDYIVKNGVYKLYATKYGNRETFKSKKHGYKYVSDGESAGIITLYYRDITSGRGIESNPYVLGNKFTTRKNVTLKAGDWVIGYSIGTINWGDSGVGETVGLSKFTVTNTTDEGNGFKYAGSSSNHIYYRDVISGAGTESSPYILGMATISTLDEEVKAGDWVIAYATKKYNDRIQSDAIVKIKVDNINDLGYGFKYTSKSINNELVEIYYNNIVGGSGDMEDPYILVR